jgi:SAM-dependent methyltransferase
VGFLPSPINFAALAGQRSYRARVLRCYRELQVAWLTPAEIFSPHYGAAYASYLAHEHDRSSAAAPGSHGLVVYEIGGGTGTFARDVLTWLRSHRPELYAGCRYTCVEISPALGALQRRRVAGEGGHAPPRFAVRVGDAAAAAAWGGASPEPCFVMMMEVLDNLPHDRVWRQGPGGDWHQTLVRSTAEGDADASRPGLARREAFDEAVAPVGDPLIRRCLEAFEAQGGLDGSGQGVQASLARLLRLAVGGGSGGDAAFLPTGALRLFDALHAVRPNHRLVAADFDALPEVVVDGWNAPLVATTRGGSTFDHGTYLVPRGQADIFFPTCFNLMRRLYLDSAAASGAGEGRAVEWMKTERFVRRFAPSAAAAAATAGGYNPLLEDYSNTAVLLS